MEAGRTNPDLLTVDVFDTVLRRNCHPDEIKLLTARHLWLRSAKVTTSPWELFHVRQQCEKSLAEGAKLQGLDGEYRFQDVLRVWIENILPTSNSEARTRIQKILSTSEMDFEKARAGLDPTIEQLLEKWPESSCLIASDFYMPAEWLRDLLVEKGFSRAVRKIYVSHDHGLSKVTGRLFEKIRVDLDVPPEKHLHVGDLFESDVLPQRRAGGMAYWFRGTTEERRKKKALCRAWKSRMNKDVRPYLGFMRRQWREVGPTPGMDPPGQRLFEEGKELCLLVGPLVLFILEEAIREGSPEILYFTREGELLAAAHRILAQANVLDMDLPEARLLEVSRQATFCATLMRAAPEEMQPFFAMYPKHSLKTLFASFDLDTAPFLPILKARGISLEKKWENLWESAEFVALWNDPEFKSRLLEQIGRKRAGLVAYCDGQGVVNESGRRYFVADIGWRGSIQDNLAKVFDGAFWSGRYLGLQRYFSEQASNSKKVSFGPDLNRSKEGQELLEYVSPLEMIFGSPHGSVQGYEVGNDGKASALRVVDRAEQAVYEKYTKSLHAGLAAALQVFGEEVRTHGLTSNELRPAAMATLKRIMHRPSIPLAQAYFQLRHNELFGSGEFVDKNRKFPYGQLVLSVFSGKSRRQINKELRESGWPQGFLTAKGLSVLVPLFNLRSRMVSERKK